MHRKEKTELICLLDLQLRLVFATPSTHILLGCNDFNGKSLLSFILPLDHTPFQHLLEHVRYSGEGRACLRIVPEKGKPEFFNCVGTRLPGDDTHVLFVGQNVTNQKRTETEVVRMAAFPRFNPNPILEFAADGTLNYSNEAALKMAQELKMEHPSAILPLNTATIVKMCLATGENHLYVQNFVNGRTLSWSFYPIEGHHVVHCYAEDITSRLNLEAQVRQMQKMESVGQLAAGIAHDFNNLLTVIQGHSGLLQCDEQMHPQMLESAKQISIAADKAANLTRQLLAFSRKQLMQPQLIDLNEVIGNITKMLKTLLGENVKLERKLAAHVSPIYADIGMIEQVMINLAVNARDAMPNGGTLQFETSMEVIDETYAQSHPESRKGHFACFKVRDTGQGMDASTMAHIFEPFFTTKAPGKGTGLGLSTVYGIVKQHCGWVDVKSEINEGTTFTIFLPTCTKSSALNETGRRSAVPGGKETIMVVEDEAALRELVHEILKKKGYTVLEAATGTQALNVWAQERHRVDMLFTDLLMPEGMTGYELAQRVLADKPELKVLYTSGYSPESVYSGFQALEGVHFLQKPYQPEMLAQAVRNCLDGKEPLKADSVC
jgi:two-component system, cell cycle sensor histidine kinase and response regulator CckA